MSELERNVLKIGGSVLTVLALTVAANMFVIKPYAEGRAYSAAWPTTVSSIGTKSVESARNSMGSFALGVTHELAPDRNKAVRGIKRNIDIIDTYYDAGVDFQEKHKLTKAEMNEFAQSVLTILDKTGLKASLDFNAKYSAAGVDAPRELWNIAILKGIVETAKVHIQVDDRLLGRIDEILDSTNGDLRADLLEAQKHGEEVATPLLDGNDRLWAGISQHLRMDPFTARSQGGVFVRIEPSDRVPKIDVMAAPVEAMVDPFALVPSLEIAEPNANITPDQG